MSLEKFIRGKVDNARHEGRRSSVRRLQATVYHEKNWQDEIVEPVVSVVMQPNTEYSVSKGRHSRIKIA